MSNLVRPARRLRPFPDTIQLFQMVEATFLHEGAAEQNPLSSSAQRSFFRHDVQHAQYGSVVLRAEGHVASDKDFGVGIANVALGMDEEGTVAVIHLYRERIRQYDFRQDPFVRLFADSLKHHLRALKQNV